MRRQGIARGTGAFLGALILWGCGGVPQPADPVARFGALERYASVEVRP